MIEVTATKLRANLFEYLDKIEQGETIMVRRNNRTIVRMNSAQPAHWRSKLSQKVKIKTSPEELIKPLDDVWDDYV
jgi:antitoxin (DNA-binding transcriptional repressor) of toxin-antitoxin stability system